jgi:hypothetical protein
MVMVAVSAAKARFEVLSLRCHVAVMLVAAPGFSSSALSVKWRRLINASRSIRRPVVDINRRVGRVRAEAAPLAVTAPVALDAHDAVINRERIADHSQRMRSVLGVAAGAADLKFTRCVARIPALFR